MHDQSPVAIHNVAWVIIIIIRILQCVYCVWGVGVGGKGATWMWNYSAYGSYIAQSKLEYVLPETFNHRDNLWSTTSETTIHVSQIPHTKLCIYYYSS